jgi:hypothetical protein
MNLKEQIQIRIGELLASTDEDPADLRGVARSLEALPICPDMSGCIAIRTDGSLVFYEWDSETCSDDIEPSFRLVALVCGSEKYPELTALLPTKPENARPCELCIGTGKVVFEGQVWNNCFCGNCSGLGWMTA